MSPKKQASKKGRNAIGPKVGTPDSHINSTVEEAPSSHQWWHDLKEDDPITLEPIASLDVPPFGLQSCGAMQYFDAVALASYITRRAVFENPLNRKPLSREECVLLDDHIQKYVPDSRNFRVADARDLQVAIRDRLAQAHDRSVATFRREARSALQGLFTFPSLQAAGSLSAGQGEGGWTVIDEDFRRHIEAEAIAAMHAATAAEAARPGGAAPSMSSSEFPELNDEALLSSERLSAAVMEGDGYARAAQAMADEAAREARKRAAEEVARKAAAREAAARRDAAARAAKATFLELQRQREALQETAAARLAEHRAEMREREEQAKAEQLRASVIALTAAAEAKKKEEQAAACKLAQEQELEDKEEKAQKSLQAEEERQSAEIKKKQKEAEKKQRQKEKKRLEKEKAAAEQARLEMEAAKRASSLKCAMCGEGILGKSFFEVMGEKFCSTSCVKKRKSENG